MRRPPAPWSTSDISTCALIDDGTYFVHEAHGDIVACGGWSRRNRLFAGLGDAGDDDRLLNPATEPARVRAMFVRSDWTRRGLGRAILEACERAARAEGFTRLALMATLPGEPLYRAYGFRATEQVMITAPTASITKPSRWNARSTRLSELLFARVCNIRCSRCPIDKPFPASAATPLPRSVRRPS